MHNMCSILSAFEDKLHARFDFLSQAKALSIGTFNRWVIEQRSKKSVKYRVEKNESGQTANFEQMAEILHLLLWLSNLNREQSAVDAISHVVKRIQLYQRDRVVNAG